MGRPLRLGETWNPRDDVLGGHGAKPKLRNLEIPPWIGWQVRSEAAQAIRWIEEYLIVPKGHNGGRPMRLAPFQRKILRTLFDAIATFVSIPAGNGKTTLLAALAVARIARGDAYAEVDVLATKQEQAGYVVQQAFRFVETLPRELAQTFAWYAKQGVLTYRPTGSTIRAHPARLSSIQGLAPDLAILDEAGFLADDLAEAMIARAVKNPAARFVGIGTPGLEPGNLLFRLKQQAASGDLPPGVRYLEWSAPDSADLFDRRAWRKANPAIGAGFASIDALATNAQLLPEAAFATYHLGRWIDHAAAWIPPQAWNSQPRTDPPPDGADVVLGVWGTYRRTLAVVGAGLDGAVFHVWAADPASDDELRDVIDRACRRWTVLEVVHARRIRANLFADLARDGRLPVAVWPADADTEASSANDLYRAIVDGRVPHDHDPLLAAHVAAVQVRHGTDGSLRLYQPPETGTPADAALAMRAAWWRASQLAALEVAEPIRIY